jgi:hypothetical protein
MPFTVQLPNDPYREAELIAGLRSLTPFAQEN